MENKYDFNFKRSESPQEIILSFIKAQIPLMLHGIPGIGKTARVMEADPDATVVSLPYKDLAGVLGKSFLDPTTGKLTDAPPSWYEELVKKCEKEPDKIHVLFFDEITNALPTIQNTAFEIVLDRRVNNKWELPKNCSIVLAGNEQSDSSAAELMPAPLYGRMGHLYLKLDVDEWLKWAVKNEIHPAIISFIAWKRDDVLLTKFTGDEPNADPRKWAMCSKLLKHTNNLWELSSLIGHGLTTTFEVFCKIQMPTIEDVVKNKFTLPTDTGARYATIGAMSSANEEQLKPVWNNLVSKMPKELQAVFTRMWCKQDTKKFNAIKEMGIIKDIYGAAYAE